MDNKCVDAKKRGKNLFFVLFISIVLLIGYYFLYVNFPKLTFKCFINEITGWNCPGCGVTRMFASFIKFNILEGVRYNYFLGITFPFVVFVLGYSSYLYIKDRKSGKLFNVFCYLYIFLLLIWGIVRNIIGL